MLDRRKPPVAGPFFHRPLPVYHQVQLSNGIKVNLLPCGTVEVLEIQFIFRGGKNYESHTGVARFTASNLAEGTQSYTSLELAQQLDKYGAWINKQAGEESLSISLASTTAKIQETLPLLAEVVLGPTFPEHEFDMLKQRTLQKMHISEQKTSPKAQRAFNELMFGNQHPYGSFYGKNELQAIEISDIKQHYEQYIYSGNAEIIVSGHFDELALLNLLEKTFGSLPTENPINPIFDTPKSFSNKGRHFIEHEGMQATLRLGHPGMKRLHPDYYGMSVVNTLFGGFFGSRLMHNIREEKGYTYGIYSGWIASKHGGYFVVQTDVGNEYIEPTIKEVKLEMQKLIEKGVEEAELQLVKNYILGKSISQRETPFQLGEILRFSIMHDISFEELDRKFEVVAQMQPADVGRLAAQYLQPDNLLEVVVGKM